ncbi:MAG: VOC family protein [Burkholderiales bacterium]|jgi:catechol 2,3-dioxygenase-like lactoylglutathione lyase family enzyme|nr:VOC family protein [Burkholderiales bacterium]
MKMNRLDHFVLTVRDIGASIAFYEALGMTAVTFGNDRKALTFGCQKINLHEASAPITPHAKTPTPGSADFCLIAEGPVDAIIAHLKQAGIAVEEGPVARTGALEPITSVYCRDPDDNLVEIACYGQN